MQAGICATKVNVMNVQIASSLRQHFYFYESFSASEASSQVTLFHVDVIET